MQLGEAKKFNWSSITKSILNQHNPDHHKLLQKVSNNDLIEELNRDRKASDNRFRTNEQTDDYSNKNHNNNNVLSKDKERFGGMSVDAKKRKRGRVLLISHHSNQSQQRTTTKDSRGGEVSLQG